MASRTYRGHRVEFDTGQNRNGQWIARATIVVYERQKEIRIPIFGRRQMHFENRAQADAYAYELAKLWIEGRLWGANGHS